MNFEFLSLNGFTARRNCHQWDKFKPKISFSSFSIVI